MKELCKKCKVLIKTLKIIKRDPIFIDPNKLNVGMEIRRWFYTNYQPKAGNYSPVVNIQKIVKIEGDLIYTISKWDSQDNFNTDVSITMREGYKNYTLEKDITK